MKRFLSLSPTEMKKLNKEELIQSIKSSEGRIILSENVVTARTYVPSVTNAEVARAFGADLILLNELDVFDVNIEGLPKVDNPIRYLKDLVSRPIGVNLEPLDLENEMNSSRVEIKKGRVLSEKTIKRVEELGFDFICLTGNPGTGVSSKSIKESIKLVRENFSGMIIAGKMHASGIDEEIYDPALVLKFIESGADVILIPSPATVPGSTFEKCLNIVNLIKKHNKLALGAIGTSQETASKETIRQIALYNKMIGFDIHHIGDAGPVGIANPENITELSDVIRGKRHTLRMICTSILR